MPKTIYLIILTLLFSCRKDETQPDKDFCESSLGDLTGMYVGTEYHVDYGQYQGLPSDYDTLGIFSDTLFISQICDSVFVSEDSLSKGSSFKLESDSSYSDCNCDPNIQSTWQWNGLVFEEDTLIRYHSGFIFYLSNETNPFQIEHGKIISYLTKVQ